MLKVRKAVFPAAGLGTRFLPATKAQPKEMLPLVDKPIIQYGVEEALAAGCDQIIIITGRGKQAIEDHFDVSYELEKMLEEKKKTDLLQIVRLISDMIHVAYVRQKEALGLGHAVLTARELVGNEPFAVLLADDVIDAPVPVLKQMMQVFEETQCSVLATQMIEGNAISAYGVLKVKLADGRFNGRLFEVLDLVEKPKPENAPSNLAVIGRYILTPEVFETLSTTQFGVGGELQLTDGLCGLLKKQKMYAYVDRKSTRLNSSHQINPLSLHDALPIFNGRLFEVLDLVEKPKPENAPSNLAVIGRYILTPEVFETLSTTQFGVGGELQLTDGLCGLLKKQKMYAY